MYSAIRSPAGLRIADGQKDGLRFASRFLERLPAPWVPVNWIVRVLQKVRGFFVDQVVGVYMFSTIWCHGMVHPLWRDLPLLYTNVAKSIEDGVEDGG